MNVAELYREYQSLKEATWISGGENQIRLWIYAVRLCAPQSKIHTKIHSFLQFKKLKTNKKNNKQINNQLFFSIINDKINRQLNSLSLLTLFSISLSLSRFHSVFCCMKSIYNRNYMKFCCLIFTISFSEVFGFFFLKLRKKSSLSCNLKAIFWLLIKKKNETKLFHGFIFHTKSSKTFRGAPGNVFKIFFFHL